MRFRQRTKLINPAVNSLCYEGECRTVIRQIREPVGYQAGWQPKDWMTSRGLLESRDIIGIGCSMAEATQVRAELQPLVDSQEWINPLRGSTVSGKSLAEGWLLIDLMLRSIMREDLYPWRAKQPERNKNFENPLEYLRCFINPQRRSLVLPRDQYITR